MASGKPSPEELDRRRKRRGRAQMLDFSTVGMVFPVALLIGYFGGMEIGSWFGRADMGSWIGLGIGFLAGFYNLAKMIRLIERRENQARDDDAPL